MERERERERERDGGVTFCVCFIYHQRQIFDLFLDLVDLGRRPSNIRQLFIYLQIWSMD